MHEGSKVERAAVVSDVRGGEYFEALRGGARRARRARRRHRVLFLTADEEALLDRYKETRRRHPLAPEAASRDGHRARARAARAAPRARRPRDRHHRAEGRRRCAARSPTSSCRAQRAGRLAVTFQSFGFKHGPPRDADLAFDVRFLPNPHYEPDLRQLTGPTRGRRLRRPRRPARGVLRAPGAAARLPAAAVRGRGQGAPDRSRSAAPAGATARSRSPSTSRRATRERDDLFVDGRAPRRRQAAAPARGPVRSRGYAADRFRGLRESRPRSVD